jgi:hypothetical protein
VDKLRGEYKRWVKKALELDPDTIGVPGNPHAYHSKKTIQEVKKVSLDLLPLMKRSIYVC